jgi:Zn-dependent peptidase ImmA (M78 family)/transcriptional regulator with XRE-family HTH domain
MFNCRRLSLARRRARLTAKALADSAGLAPDTISRLENGRHNPDEETVERLARALKYPVSFFYRPDAEELDVGAVSFRSFSKMSAREREAACAAGELGLELNAWVESRFELPKADLLDLSYEENPEAAATAMREFWGIGEKPIGNILALIESRGGRVFSLSENTASVNAFSFWRDEKPFIFLNNFKTAESSNFDIAHELGHLVMHKHGDPKLGRHTERDADQFASAFLMPRNDVRARFPLNPTVDFIINAKGRWKVSAFAMTRRLFDLGRLTEWQYKSTCIELSRRRYRTSEPIGVERETSIIWRKVLTQLWTERLTKNDIAEDLNIPLEELEGLIWQLAGADQRPTTSTGLRRVDH